MNSASFLTNRGISYPFQISGSIKKERGIDYIRQGIKSHLDTNFFELLFKPTGSRLRELLFEPIDEILYDSLTIFISEALTEIDFINFNSVRIDPDSTETNTVNIYIDYSLNQPRMSDTLLYQLVTNPDSGSFTDNSGDY